MIYSGMAVKLAVESQKIRLNTCTSIYHALTIVEYCFKHSNDNPVMDTVTHHLNVMQMSRSL